MNSLKHTHAHKLLNDIIGFYKTAAILENIIIIYEFNLSFPLRVPVQKTGFHDVTTRTFVYKILKMNNSN